jgi:hypothetical protein
MSLHSPNGFRQTEVQHFDRTLGRDHDIRWFQVTMNDSLRVRSLQSSRHLARTI